MQGKGNKNRHPVITFGYDANKVVVHQSLRKKRVVVQQLDFKAVKEEYPSEIVNNIKALEDNSGLFLTQAKMYSLAWSRMTP